MSDQCSVFSVQSADEVSRVVREHRRVSVRGRGTKCAPDGRGSRQSSVERAGDGADYSHPSSTSSDSAALDMRSLSGITEYEPAEYTITVKAGTTLDEIVETLDREGQHLPFDPLFAKDGATIGGTVATAMNGPGRLRYGGVRDFIIGVRFVDGAGHLLHGGGKVVKNAAGFDFPKLLVGSFGKLGVMTELTFKVFPKPEARMTLMSETTDLHAAVDLVCRVARGQFDVEAVDLLPPGKVIVRIAGHEAALKPRLDAMRKALGVPLEEAGAQPLITPRVVKVALVPSVVSALDSKLAAAGVGRCYTVACNVAFIEWQQKKGLSELDEILSSLQLGGVALNADRIWIGKRSGLGFLERVKSALDPQSKFGPFV